MGERFIRGIPPKKPTLNFTHGLFLGLENLMSLTSKQTRGTFQWSLSNHNMVKTKIFVGGFLSFQKFTGNQKEQNLGFLAHC